MYQSNSSKASVMEKGVSLAFNIYYIMIKKSVICFLFLISIIYSKSYSQANARLYDTAKPVILGSAPKNAEIKGISIYEHSTYISIAFKSSYNNENIKISSKSAIYDPLNPFYKFVPYMAENVVLDKVYTLGPKGNITNINILFSRIPPGISKINVLIESENNTFLWQNVVINNPDTHPRSNWTESGLIEFWNLNGLSPNEGIYEMSNQPISPKLKIGVIWEENQYRIIYLNGFDAGIYKEGDLQGYMIETAIQNMYKVSYFQGNKELETNFYGRFEHNVIKLSLKDNYREINYTFIKLFPSINDDIVKNNTKVSGSGFAISRDGFIITNNHVIEGSTKIEVTCLHNETSITYTAILILTDKVNDLALLKIEDDKFKSLEVIPYTINFNLSPVGETVFVLGYPLRSSMGDEVKLTNGIISSKTGYEGDVNSYTLSVPIQPGNSGGPIFNKNGNIIGIINAKHSNAENVSYAIKSSYMKNLLDLLDNPIQMSSTNLLNGKDLVQQVDLVKKFIFIIVAE